MPRGILAIAYVYFSLQRLANHRGVLFAFWGKAGSKQPLGCAEQCDSVAAPRMPKYSTACAALVRRVAPGNFPPEAPTDPYMTLSRHTAPVIQPPPVHRANEQTSQAAAGRSALEAHDCGDASDAAMRSAPD